MITVRDQKDLLAAMGVALILIQTTEKVIRVCMTFVIQKASPLDLENFEKQERQERRKTLGYFLAELRKRVSIEPCFDSTLDEFLEARNKFVHELDDVEGWGFGSEEMIVSSKEFVHSLISKTEHILNVFLGVLRAWEEQVSIPVPNEVSDLEFLRNIDSHYKPLIKAIFWQKDESTLRNVENPQQPFQSVSLPRTETKPC